MKSKQGLVVLFSALLVVAGCSAPKKVRMTTKFDKQAHQEYTQEGQFTVSGQAFLQRKGVGGIVTCAGHQITLAPNTEFFREMVEVYKNVRFPDVDPGLYRDFYRTATCDASGHFVFEKVPSLSWFVVSDAAWFPGRTQGMFLLKQVDVTRNKKVLLSEGDYVTYIGE